MVDYIQVGGQLLKAWTYGAQRLSLLPIDGVANAVTTLDYAHHEIHGGSSYTSSGSATLGVGATQDVLIVTPNTTKWAHFLGYVNASGQATISFYEDTTTSDDGAAATELNRNRNSANTAGLVITTGPTVSGAGTLLFTTTIGSGRTSGEVRETDEWILKQNAKYMLRITSAAASNLVNWVLNWYEHTSR